MSLPMAATIMLAPFVLRLNATDSYGLTRLPSLARGLLLLGRWIVPRPKSARCRRRGDKALPEDDGYCLSARHRTSATGESGSTESARQPAVFAATAGSLGRRASSRNGPIGPSELQHFSPNFIWSHPPSLASAPAVFSRAIFEIFGNFELPADLLSPSQLPLPTP